MGTSDTWPGLLGPGREHQGIRRLITADPAMRQALDRAVRLATGDTPILLTGETGTGKTLLARAIHEESGRRGRFVKIHLGGVTSSVLAREVLGEDTQAPCNETWDKARGGTLLLDEIGTLGRNGQRRLMSLVRECCEPRPGDRPRLVLTTNLSEDRLGLLEADGALLRDLLRDSTVHLPPLRERPDDLPVLVKHFLREASESLGRKRDLHSRELTLALAGYCFPGNIQELKSIVTEAVLLHLAGADPFLAIQSRIASWNARPAHSRRPAKSLQSASAIRKAG